MDGFLEEKVFDLGPEEWTYCASLSSFRKASWATGSKGRCRESWLETRPGNLDGSDPVGPAPKQSASTWGESLLADSSSCSQLDGQG